MAIILNSSPSPSSPSGSSSSSSSGYEKECQEIHASLNQLGLLVQALAHRTLDERRQIGETYRQMYGKDLAEHLHQVHVANTEIELSNMLYQWMLDPHDRDAVVANNAIRGFEADYKALIEIYTGRKSNQIFDTNQAYLARFKRNLDQDIISLPSHPYQKILVALATSHRAHHVKTSQHIAKCDAKRLYEAGKTGTREVDESVILEMFSKRSLPQLRLTLSTYRCIYGHNYTKAMRKQNHGDFAESLRVVVKCMHEPAKYYSKMLYTTIQRPEPNKSVLSRLVMHSEQWGMKEIIEAYLKKYGMKLQDAICNSVPAGEDKEFLLALTYEH